MASFQAAGLSDWFLKPQEALSCWYRETDRLCDSETLWSADPCSEMTKQHRRRNEETASEHKLLLQCSTFTVFRILEDLNEMLPYNMIEKNIVVVVVWKHINLNIT